MNKNKLQKIITVILIVLVSVAAATWLCYADEIHLSWDASVSPEVTSYKVYMGTPSDLTTWTWEEIGEVTAPATDYIYDLQTNELRLFRVSACTEAGLEAVRYNAGAFSCFGWELPPAPTRMGME